MAADGVRLSCESSFRDPSCWTERERDTFTSIFPEIVSIFFATRIEQNERSERELIFILNLIGIDVEDLIEKPEHAEKKVLSVCRNIQLVWSSKIFAIVQPGCGVEVAEAASGGIPKRDAKAIEISAWLKKNMGHFILDRTLNFSSVGLTLIPDCVTLACVEVINLSWNKITTLPIWMNASLRHLDLRGNNLTSVDQLLDLPSLQTVILGGNPDLVLSDAFRSRFDVDESDTDLVCIRKGSREPTPFDLQRHVTRGHGRRPLK